MIVVTKRTGDFRRRVGQPGVVGVCAAIDHWGTTPEERRRHYPCDDVVPDAGLTLFRAVSVDAPPAVVFRWLCQLKVAPYSYDLVDNWGRRSPRHLTPEVEQLVVGERVMVFTLASFTTDEQLTLVVKGHRVFGDLAMSYVIHPEGPDQVRLIGKVAAMPAPGLLGAVMWRVLPAGDLVMMRRQLLNLKGLAEATSATDLAP